MESSTAIITRALMLFAVLAAVPLWVMSGLTIDDLVRPFRGERSASPAPRTEVALGDEVEEFPFAAEGERDPFQTSDRGGPDVEIAIPDVGLGESPRDDEPSTPQGNSPPFWDNPSPDGAGSPEYSRFEPDFAEPPGPPGDDRDGAPQVSEADNDIDALIQRLDHLGAVHMVQTRLGGGRAYRFRCEFPIPANAERRRFFEATDTSQARAIHRVLREVERWRMTQSQF